MISSKIKVVVTSFLCAVALVHVTCAIGGNVINVFAGKHGDAMLIDSDESKTLLVAGGAIPRGQATPSDCFAKATLHLKNGQNFYEGPLNPVHTEILDSDAGDISGKQVDVFIYPSRIYIVKVEVDGICADGIDFSGDYKKVAEQSARYASTFTYFMRMEDQNAADMRKNGKLAEANEELRPFIETNHSKLKLDNQDRNAVESISKEYGLTPEP